MTRQERMGVRAETWRLFKDILKKVAPPPDIPMSVWAETYRYLSMESAAEPGRYHMDRAPYQKAPMDAITDINVRKVVLMWASQTGKTTSAVLNTIGYYIHYEPSPMLFLEPTVSMSESISKNMVSPMLRDTPVLCALVSQKSRDRSNTILEKQFPGGYIAMQGANSPSSLAARPIRVLLADEIDRYPASAGVEGDPLMLAEKRLTTFWNSKEVVTSTPTIKGFSKIETEFEHSTKEVWNVPCPKCGEYQPLTWAKIVFDASGFREGTNREVRAVCEHCKRESGEQEWRSQFLRGKYIAEFPRRKTRGFFVNALSSGFTTWEKITEDFLKAKDESKYGNTEPLKTWTNTVLAETWDEEGVQMDERELMKRAEDYGAQVPEGVVAITCGVDTQDNRFEYEIVGWGMGKESWGLEKGEIYGDLKEKDVWEKLDQTLLRSFEKGDGTKLTIAATCMDSQGHFTNEVDRFCKERWGRNVWSIKGKGGMDVAYVGKPSTSNRVKVPKYTIGVDTGKVLLYDRLKVEKPGPGYCHFPKGRGYDENYYRGLTAEKKIITYKKGRATIAWVLKSQGFRRNEPLDIRNYATAAVEIAHIDLEPGTAKAKAGKKRRVRKQGISEEDV